MTKLPSLLIAILLLTGFKGFAYVASYSIYDSSDNLKADSLRTLPATKSTNKTDPADTSTVNRLINLAADFFNINPDSTLHYSKLAIEKSLAIKYDKGIADGLLYTGKAYARKGDYALGRKNLDEAKQRYINSKNEKGLSDCFFAYGMMYEVIASYNQATSNLKQALEIRKRIKDEPGIARCYNGMGIVQGDIGKSSDALDYYFKSLSINIKLHRKADAASNYNNIGTIFEDLEIYPKSMEYYKRAISLWMESHNMVGISIAYLNIAEILIAQKKYDPAIVYLSKSMKLSREHDDNDMMSLLYADFGICYAYKRQYQTSLSNYSLALQIATVHNIAADKANAYTGFATVYNMQTDYRQAYRYAALGKALADKLGNLSLRVPATLQLSEALGGLKKFEAFKVRKQYAVLKDSLKNDETIQKLTSFNLESNFADKQRRIAEQQQRMEERYKQNIQRRGLLIAMFSVIIIALSAVLIVYYRAKRNQQRINAVLVHKNQQVSQQQAELEVQAQKINDSNILKDRLIAVLAHDLRSPLGTLRGLFSLLEDEDITQEQFLSMIPNALRKLDQTAEFLDTLLFWINSQLKNFGGSAKMMSIKDIVMDKVSSYQEQAAEKAITLTGNVPGSPVVFADENSVKIVLRNLITNAIKFSKPSDTITISAYQQDENNVLLSVKDTGVGMTETQRNKLFKNKVDSQTGTNNESGTGMGLLFCKDLVEKCNGKIWVESKPGQGTEFFFTLPSGSFNEKEAASSS